MVSKVYKSKKSKCSAKSEQNHPSVRSELEQFAEASRDAIRIINSDFTIRYINQAFAEMTGVNQNDVVGKKCWEVFPSPLCHTTECRLQRILNGEKQVQVEITRQKKDGTIIPCIVTTSLLMDKMGKLAGIIEQFRDITEHRRMEAQINESEERYRAMIDVSAEAGEAIVMLRDIDDKEGIQVFVNEQWPRITGYTREELIDKSFFEMVVPADRKTSVDRHRRKMSGESIAGLFEMNIIRNDGTEIPVEVTGGFTIFQGKKANVLYIRDITQRKLMEKKLQDEKERYQSIFDNIPVAVQEMDYSDSKRFLDGLADRGITDFDKYFDEHPDALIEFEKRQKIISGNKAHFQIFEVDKVEDFNIIGVNEAVQSKKSHKQGQKLLPFKHKKTAMLSIVGGQRQESHESVILTAKGNRRHIQFWHSIAPGHEHDLSRVFITMVDITDRVKAEKALNDYRKHLEQIVARRTQQLEQAAVREKELFQSEHHIRKELENQIEQKVLFTRALVHEIKTPLTPLLAASEVLVEQAENAQIKSIAETIQLGAISLDEKIDELLDLARGELGMLTINTELCDLVKIIKSVSDYMSYLFKRRSQTLELDIDESIPSVKIDARRVRQILINLLDNASKFTPKKGTIIIRAKAHGKKVLVEVEDNGLGIPDDEKSKIFTPYYTMKSKHLANVGIGLGLSLSKILVDLHGGEIWVQDKASQGSTLAFTLPL